MTTDIVNTTPHPIRFQDQDGSVRTVPPCGVVLGGTPVEVPAGTHPSGAALVTVTWRPNTLATVALRQLQDRFPAAVLVGSMIAAQTFPGEVCAVVPAAGFERVPPDQRVCRADKFTVF